MAKKAAAKPVVQTADISVVLDRSGSMETIRKDTIGGFNTFLAEQQALPGAAKLSLFQFDTMYEPNYEGVAIKDAKPLSMETFVPRGGTALYDAIGRTVIATEARKPEGKVIIVITTDGHENSSREYNAASVKTIIERKRADGWEFVFLGANQDACLTAVSMGMAAGSAMSVAANAMGTQAMYSSTSVNLKNLRSGASASMSYSTEDRAAQAKAGAKP